MNEAVYERVRERVNEYNLSEQEIKAIDTARRQLNTHSKLFKHPYYNPIFSIFFFTKHIIFF